MIQDLRLQNFRSYQDSTFKFSPNTNIIVGPNASGKTNLLEAVLIIANGKSYRGKEADLIKFDKSWARLDALLTTHSRRTVKMATDYGTFNKNFEIEGNIYKRLTIKKKLPVVLFEPNHLLLLSGSPELRRNYLDDILEKTITGYSALRKQYKRTLIQRNSLLKNKVNDSSILFPWNFRLSHLAGQIVKKRSNLIDLINKDINKTYQTLAGVKTKIDIKYDNYWPEEGYETSFLKFLDQYIDQDILKGFTSKGPHREDFSLFYNGFPAAIAASRGEIRTAIITLKVMELNILHKSSNLSPILLLDDVFSELDSTRRDLLTKYLKVYQVLITTTNADLIVKNFSNNCNIMQLPEQNTTYNLMSFE